MSRKNLLYWLFQILGWGFIIFIGILNDFQNSQILITKTIRGFFIVDFKYSTKYARNAVYDMIDEREWSGQEWSMKIFEN